MSASKLQLYNEALLLLGERSLASLTESRTPRRVLDSVWDNNAIDACLERGQWVFATRAVQLEYSPSVEPDFGFTRGFDKPTDFIRTAAISSEETFNCPLLQYSDEGGFWFSNLDTIFVKYVSNDESFGADLSLWPQTFAKYVAAYLATEAASRITQDDNKWVKLDKIAKRRLVDALSKDAMAKPTIQMPNGSWVRARLGGTNNDGGNRGSLIG